MNTVQRFIVGGVLFAMAIGPLVARANGETVVDGFIAGGVSLVGVWILFCGVAWMVEGREGVELVISAVVNRD